MGGEGVYYLSIMSINDLQPKPNKESTEIATGRPQGGHKELPKALLELSAGRGVDTPWLTDMLADIKATDSAGRASSRIPWGPSKHLAKARAARAEKLKLKKEAQ